MVKSLISAMLAFGLVACTGGASNDGSIDALKDGAKPGAGGGRAGGGSSGERTLASGTRVSATIQDALSSRANKPGETVRASVSADVKDAKGRTVIPAGSVVTLTIGQLEPGSDQVRPEGRLSLVVNSVTVNGKDFPLTASLEPVPHKLQGRGVTTDEAARIGAGTAIGAVAGQIIGKNTRSTVIGGAVGAVAGTAVAVRYAYRDIVVSAGTPIVFTLEKSLNLPSR